MWHWTHDMWHMKLAMWHLTHNRWQEVNLLWNLSSLALTEWEWRFVEDIFTKDDSLTHFIINQWTEVIVEQPRPHRVCLKSSIQETMYQNYTHFFQCEELGSQSNLNNYDIAVKPNRKIFFFFFFFGHVKYFQFC